MGNKDDPKLQYGDVIGVDRGFYQHYGVYIGDNQVVHYAGIRNDYSGRIIIHITSLEHFMGVQLSYFVCDFSKFKKEDEREKADYNELIVSLTSPKLNLEESNYQESYIIESFQNDKFSIYNPKQTVQRAYSRLGESCLDYFEGNCEHFAIWCKTGIEETYYVNLLYQMIKE